MNKTTAALRGIVPALLLAALAGNGFAASAFEYDSWQERRLMEPNGKELKDEARGKVFIYDGLEADKVDQAMDAHFERIDSMMFTRTQYPAPSGEGTVAVDDGCE
jgi:hypothetical protein